MCKRFIASVVAILMVVSLCPAAYADDGGLAAGASNELAGGVRESDGAGDAGARSGGGGEGSGSEPSSEKPAPVRLDHAKVTLPRKVYAYTGKSIIPKPIVTVKGKKVKRSCYKVTCKDNVKVGVATLTVKGRRAKGYADKKSVTFKIYPQRAAIASVASPTGASLSASAAKVAGATGYQFLIGTDPQLVKDSRKLTTTKSTLVVSRLAEGRRYYVKARAYATIDGKTAWGAWSKTCSATVKWNEAWLQVGDYYTLRTDNGKLAHGLTVVDGRTYLIDGYHHQRTGWQRYRGAWRFFYPENMAGGYMATNCVVNGIRIDGEGVAHPNGAGWEEISVMHKAQKLVERLTVPTMSRDDKLRRGFSYVKDECVEALTRTFSDYDGWHRAMALDVLNDRTGSCFSYGAALAYYANAIGYGRCAAISSGGHGWAEIDGRVYDAEWSRHCGRDLFGISYDERTGGLPAYGNNRAYVVDIAPNTREW